MPRHEAPGSPFPIAGTVSYPPTPCTDALWRPGRWLRCFHTPEPCTRTGWVWVPDACHFRIFPSAALQRFPRPVWLVFAGTSVHRGTFFAAVDALMGRRAENLTSDRVWRCWGWMDLTYKNVRVSYLDLRFTVLFLRQPRPIAEPAYTDHAVRALRALGAAAGGGPDLFYLEMGLNPGTPHEPALIRSWLGPGWAGRFLVHFVKPCAATDYCGDRLELAARGRRPPALGWIEDHPESGVEYVDESHMALPFIHDQEHALRHKSSQHLHRPCKPEREGGMHSCSAVADMAFQAVLNALMRSPRPAGALRDRRFYPSDSGGGVRFCEYCPVNLIPFTVAPEFERVARCHGTIPGGNLTAALAAQSAAARR